MLGKLDSYMQKNQSGQLSYTMHKNKSKLIEDLNMRPESIKLLEENIGSTLFDISLSNVFFGSVSSGNKKKGKNKQMGLNQTEKLLHNKGNYLQIEKAAF